MLIPDFWHINMLKKCYREMLILVCFYSVVKDSLRTMNHDDVIKWKHFLRYWPFVRGIQRSPVNFPHKGQWHGASMFSLICVWINDWADNHEAGDLRRYRADYVRERRDWSRNDTNKDKMEPKDFINRFDFSELRYEIPISKLNIVTVSEI